MAIFSAVTVGLIMVIGFGVAGYELFWKLRYVVTGVNDGRANFDDLGDRAFGFVKYVLGQARTIREPNGMLHFFIFWGFVVLQSATIELLIRGFMPSFRLGAFIGMPAYNGMLFVQDLFHVFVFVAVVAMIIRRFVVKPDHTTQTFDGAVILGLELLLVITAYLGHAFEIAHANPAELGYSAGATPVALLISQIFGGQPALGAEGPAIYGVLSVVFYTAFIATVAFFAYWIATGGKHIHLIGATSNVFFRKLEPKGSLYPIDLEDEDAEYFGASKMEDLSWKQLLDTYACTECARCEHYCPAFNTGKPLNPMMLIQKLKAHVKEKGAKVYRRGEEDDYAPLAGGIISKEELMACTTCGACVQNCPVFIEHVDTIVDMRRYLVLTEADMPAEWTRTFKSIENSSNPWGISSSKREDWAKDLDVPVMANLDGHIPEYLYFVGCMGSFDDRQKKVSTAMVKILKTAGIDFAILGNEEGCTGDAPRRAGNEYLYWMCATQNIETLNNYKITKILTACPHGFQTLGKEYPQLGGNYHVIHHTKLLNDLLKEGRLKLRNEGARTYTYHDSCYIGRWSNDYANPREALAQVPGLTISEMSLNKRKAMCCGAGGARMWMEENEGIRVNVARADQALETGAEGLIVNCPFCNTMLTDGLAARDASYRPVDLAEVIADALITDPVNADTGDAAE